MNVRGIQDLVQVCMYVIYTYFSHKWYEVMFAQTKHFNIFYHNHFVRVFMKYCILNCFFYIVVVALGEKHHCFSGSSWSIQKSFSGRIFTNEFQNLRIVIGNDWNVVNASTFISDAMIEIENLFSKNNFLRQKGCFISTYPKRT